MPRSDAQLARSVALAPERRCVVDGRSVSVTNPCGLQDARDFLREQLGVNLEPEDDDGAALDPPHQPVESIADYRERADECLRRAQQAKDDAARDYWRNSYLGRRFATVAKR